MEKDPGIKFIIVGLHHSPYTNSTVIDSSKDVQRDFVPLFLKSKKCKLFVSGHAHAFEHFKINNKDFIVIGGGGGLQHPLRISDKEGRKDLFPNKTVTRMFHYILCEETDKIFIIKVMMLNDDFKTFNMPYEIKIPFGN
jgi:hypothetical protein